MSILPVLELILENHDRLLAQHRRSVRDAWSIANDLLNLHDRVLQSLAKLSGTSEAQPSPSDRCVIGIGAFALNTTANCILLALRGEFGTAATLIRALFDCDALVYATGVDEEIAERWEQGRYKASSARKRYVQDLQAIGATHLSEKTERFFLDYGDTTNLTAHVHPLVIAQIVDTSGGLFTPVIGGLNDPDRSLLMMRDITMLDRRVVASLQFVRTFKFGTAFDVDFEEFVRRFNEWATSPNVMATQARMLRRHGH